MERISEEDLERYQALVDSVNPRTNIVAFATFYAEHVPILMDALRQAYARIDELEAGLFQPYSVRRQLAVDPAEYLTTLHGGDKSRTQLVDPEGATDG